MPSGEASEEKGSLVDKEVGLNCNQILEDTDENITQCLEGEAFERGSGYGTATLLLVMSLVVRVVQGWPMIS